MHNGTVWKHSTGTVKHPPMESMMHALTMWAGSNLNNRYLCFMFASGASSFYNINTAVIAAKTKDAKKQELTLIV